MPSKAAPLFLRFQTQEERRAYGGSAFLELQVCSLPLATPLERILSGEGIEHWRTDSLYLQEERFGELLAEYGTILADGQYPNRATGAPDPYGITYYDAAKTGHILEKLQERAPRDGEILLAWLREHPHPNGFFLLGV